MGSPGRITDGIILSTVYITLVDSPQVDRKLHMITWKEYANPFRNIKYGIGAGVEIKDMT